MEPASAIHQLIDNYSSKQFGENGHIEYGWSNSFQEKILQFHFQLTRTNDCNIQSLKMHLDHLLCDLKKCNQSQSNIECVMSIVYLRTLYKMIGHTRDIIHGKGEYTLTYMMIYTWYNYYPELALYALETLVTENPCGSHPFGSWKDIKYFCNYCKMQGCASDHPLIARCILLVNSQLYNDMKLLEKQEHANISLVSKWVPREKSAKFGWLYPLLACDYFSNYLKTATLLQSYDKAVTKCKMEYRQMLSYLNQMLDTVQIKQCKNEWRTINFKNITSITMTKQKKAFLNVLHNGIPRYESNNDRNECAEHFKTYVSQCQKEKVNIKGKRVSLCDFTEHALQLLDMANNLDQTDPKMETIKTEMDILNSQWKDNTKQNGSFGKMIAMVDVSSSMDGKPLQAAIALGIRVAENSIIGKRVLNFSAYPSWINLDGKDTFVEMVDALRSANWGMNANFYAALDMILDAIVEAKMAPEDVEGMVLAVFSDMQIDHADNNSFTMYTSIKQKYEITGMRLHGKPFTPPHILFWNLRSTNGFPNLSSQAKTSMLSGFSPMLLNLFDERGIQPMKSCTPWVMLETALSNPRYTILETFATEVFTNHITT